MATLCTKCTNRRSERKEIITEIVETEVKYGRDLRIIVEEFYRPMLVAGLLSPDLLATIFLNVDELIQVNNKFAEPLAEPNGMVEPQPVIGCTEMKYRTIFSESK